ncbi:hypothetical protein DBR17_12825 [Sphingomonas sp. HMWF008]|nr:hypothetical protein DBR17_12825 [Sphingomonas sp. HMWF008]
MSDILIAILCAFGALLFGWALIRGLRSGTMEPVHHGSLRAQKTENPFLFWLYATFNAIFLLGSLWLTTSYAFDIP